MIIAGFGLGALNDADEDDLDVYDRGMDQGSRRVAYEGNEDDGQIILTSRNKPAQGQVSGAEQVRCRFLLVVIRSLLQAECEEGPKGHTFTK